MYMETKPILGKTRKRKRVPSTYFFDALANCAKESIERNKDAVRLSVEIKSPHVRVSYELYGRCLRDVIFKVRRNVLSIARNVSWGPVDQIHWEHYRFRNLEELANRVSSHVGIVAECNDENDYMYIYHRVKRNGLTSKGWSKIAYWHALNEGVVARIMGRARADQ